MGLSRVFWSIVTGCGEKRWLRKELGATGNQHQTAASGLFPSGKQNIFVERRKFFSDPVT